MNQMTGLTLKIQEMAGRIKELRDITGISAEEMAKKTVLKRVLKYAPLKSDFVRGIVQDGTIKTEISEDMYSVNNTIEVEDYSFEETTGEVTESDTDSVENNAE